MRVGVRARIRVSITAPRSERILEEGCGDGAPPAEAAAAPELAAQ